MYKKSNTMNTIKSDINKLFNFALIAVGFSNYNDYIKTHKSRKLKYTFKRHVLAWLLMNKIEGLSTMEIGYLMNKDHATVIHSIKKIKELYEINYKPIVNLVNNSSEKFKELVYNDLNLEQETDSRIMLELILEAINNGMEINEDIKNKINSLYKDTLKFLNNSKKLSSKVIKKKIIRNVKF